MRYLSVCSFILVSILLGNACRTTLTPVDSQPQIYGGEITDISNYPFLVNIYDENYSPGHGTWRAHKCAGVLIEQNIVLSAAHCFVPAPGFRNYPKIVVVGDSFNRNGMVSEADPDASLPKIQGEVFRKLKVIPHPDFLRKPYTLKNDLALIVLEDKIPDQKALKTLAINLNPELPESLMGQKCPDSMGAPAGNCAGTVVGWGQNELSGAEDTEELSRSHALRHVRVDIQKPQSLLENPDSVCFAFATREDILKYEPEQFDKALHICAFDQANVRSSCVGDSGGPLLINNADEGYTLAGIVSFGGADYNCQSQATIFTRVSNYKEWIQETISQFSKQKEKPKELPPQKHIPR